MKILVTGGLGYLGSWITKGLVQNGHLVTTFGTSDRKIHLDLAFDRRFGDISNLDDLRSVFCDGDFDAVIHLASFNSANDQAAVERSLKVNALGTRNLLQVIADNPEARTHLIYFSTFHVYGRSAGIIDESTTPEPRSDYATTHLFAEQYVRQFHLVNAVPYTIFRLTNGYGAPFECSGRSWELALNDMCRMALRTKEIRLRSNGKGRRNFVWLGDVCDVVEKCLSKGPVNRVFNLAGDVNITSLEMAEIVRSVLASKFNRDTSIVVNEADQSAHSQALSVETTRLRNWIDYSPVDQIRQEAMKILDLLSQDLSEVS